MKTLRTLRKKTTASQGSQDVSLPITSMADIFTILLVFLIKSYSSGSLSISPSAGLQLPVAEAAADQIEALKVEIGKTAINIEGQPVVSLNDFVFPEKDIKGGVSESLSQSIQRYRERQKWITQANSDVKMDSKLVLIADQNAPYRAIKSVLASAAIHGYTDFKLVVVNKNQ